MSDWATSKPGSAYGGTDRDQLHSSASLVARSGRSGGRRLLSARELLLIWTLFVLGFVLILSAAVAYSARFAGAGTACLLCGIASIVGAFVWQCRASGAQLADLGKAAAAASTYSQVPAPGVGASPYNIQDDAAGDGAPAALHF